jgi:two-component system, NarL family, sensor kinase
MKQGALFGLLFFLFVTGFGQNKTIDSLQLLVSQSEGKNKLKALLAISSEYRYVNADTARSFAIEALQMAKAESDVALEAEALYNIGVTHQAQGNYTEALEYEERALELQKKTGDPAKTAKTLNGLGIIYDEKGDYEKALTHYYEALKIFESLNDEDKMAMVLTNIGIVLKAQKEYANAADHYRKAAAIYHRLDNRFGLASCQANLGSVYLFVPNYDSALHYSLLASDEFEKQNMRQVLPITWGNAARALEQLGQVQQAEELLLKAKAMHAEYDNKKELSFTLIQLARLENKQNHAAQATQFANEGLALAKRINAVEQIMQGHEVLSSIYASTGNYLLAWKENQLYTSNKDSLFQLEKSKQLQKLQTQYETEKKDRQISDLNKDNKIKAATIERNYFFFGGLVIILSLTFLFWSYHARQKQKIIAQEQKMRLREAQITAVIESQEKERKRFASDLHDGMGQLITALQLNIQAIKQNNGMEKAISQVENSEHLLNEIQMEIRHIAFNLMPPVLIKEGLVPAVRELARRVNKSGSINIELSTHDLPARFSPLTEVSIYRIIQELISNMMKHSGADTIIVSFTGFPDEVVLTLEDNGQGYDLPLFQNSKYGNGWSTIQTRLNLIKAQIEFDTIKGRRGSTVIINLPLEVSSEEKKVSAAMERLGT